ncbi:MAG: hypothetical protein N2235_09730 [Fischerella sp.]|nr:hypothetical protein [Fischerella sp.]
MGLAQDRAGSPPTTHNYKRRQIPPLDYGSPESLEVLILITLDEVKANKYMSQLET